ncbi:MAG TPA: TetR/AcrR family transcriptional regulator, partial [Pseudomonadales bacterium]
MMTIATPRPAGKRERTRQAILNAAMQIIASKGLEAASIDELMQQAGMARGTFYNYFQSREDVLNAVVEQIRDHLHEQIEARIPASVSAPETIVACMMYGVLQYSLDHPCIGWVLVRLGGDNDWFAPYDVDSRQFPRADDALLAMVKRDMPFLIIHTYIEGTVNTLLRRALKQHLSIDQ